MPHKTRLTLIAASIILIIVKIKLQAFRVGGTIFRIADEMHQLLAYFDNPAMVFSLSCYMCVCGSSE